MKSQTIGARRHSEHTKPGRTVQQQKEHDGGKRRKSVDKTTKIEKKPADSNLVSNTAKEAKTCTQAWCANAKPQSEKMEKPGAPVVSKAKKEDGKKKKEENDSIDDGLEIKVGSDGHLVFGKGSALSSPEAGVETKLVPDLKKFTINSVPPPPKDIRKKHPGRPDLDYEETPVGPAKGLVEKKVVRQDSDKTATKI